MKRKYPTQEDAQVLIDIINRTPVDSWSASPEYQKLGRSFNKFPKGWVKMWDKTFGSKSPWSYERRFNGKCVLYWDKNKAALLNF